MVEVLPFAATRYVPERVGGLSAVTCPPYDVINDEQRDQLYNRSEYNVVRLVLGKTYDSDSERDNRYTRAASLLKQWQQEGVLVRDPEPAVYAYEQQFTVGGNQYSRLGFIAAVGLQDFSQGGIVPHERTLSKPKADRLQLMRATDANLSPIFGIYADESGEVDRILRQSTQGRQPDVVIDDSGTINRIWPIAGSDAIEAIRRRMLDAQVLIADGHHRYETCLNYQREVRQRLGDCDAGRRLGCDHTMMMLVNMHGPGLVVFPTHRVIHGLAGFNPAAILQECKQWFDVEQVDPSRLQAIDDMTADRYLGTLSVTGPSAEIATTFGLYMGGSLYLLKLGKGRSAVEAAMDRAHSPAWRKLDVSILHTVVVGRVMGISDEDQLRQTNIRYTRSLREAISLVDSAQCQAALLMDPTSVDEVREVAASGEIMPQKSTYFYPKLLTGLVMRALDTPSCCQG